MSLFKNLSNLENNMKGEGIYIDSTTLNKLQYYFMKEEDLNRIHKAELFNEIDDDIIFTADIDEVVEFFESIFTDVRLIDHFNINYGMFIDFTKQGEVNLREETNVKNLSPELIQIALIQLVGKEELEEVISFYSSVDFTVLNALQNRLTFEIESRLVDNFKPLAKRSAKLYEEFELAMTK